MASNETIKSFLVSLGWKVDTAGMNRFASSIAIQTEAVRELANGLKSAATSVVDFVRETVSGMNSVYLTSLRLKTSVANVKALQYAAKQTGIDYSAFTSQLSSFRVLLEQKPGYRSVLAQFGIDANQSRDSLDIFRDTLKKLNSMPQPFQGAMATKLGIDQVMLDMLKSGEFDRMMDEAGRMMSGTDVQKSEKLMHDAANAANRLQFQLEILKDKAILALVDAWNQLSPETRQQIKDFFDLGQQIERLKSWIHNLVAWWNSLSEGQKKAIKWTAAISAAIVALVAALTALGVGLTVVITAFTTLTTVFEGVTSAIGLIFSPVGLAVAALAALAYAGYKTYESFKEWRAGGDTLIPWTQLAEKCRFFKEEVKSLASIFKDNLKPVVSDIYGILSDLFTGNWRGAKEKLSDVRKIIGQGISKVGSSITESAKKAKAETAQGEANRKQPRGIRNNNPGNIVAGAFARAHGATGVEAAGKFATFATAQAGLDADAALLRQYAQQGVDTVRSIISKYAPKNENNTAAYIASVAKKLGVDPNAHLNLSDPKMLAGIEQAIVQIENGRNPYSADMYAAAANRAISGTKDVNITQHITTTVTGSSNPQEAGQALTGSLYTANGLLIRTFQPRLS